ncbi:MAG: hemolysin family protein [Chloroherpetonaceae bacterium]|nr:hemolysin family protein [Chloroherpetonaceae bacterium]MDW8437610.1 hemolysin family protein [Chloroherpetonaceae bacterium]
MDIDLSEFLLKSAPLLVSIPILLLFSAFFSASEVAFFSLNPNALANRAANDATTEKLRSMLAAPKRLLATMVIGNALSNAGVAIVAINFAERLAETFAFSLPIALSLEVVVVALLVLVFGEIAPKTFAAKRAEEVARRAARFVNFFQILFYPFSEAAIQLSRLLEALLIQLKLQWRGKKEFSDEEIQVIAELGIERANLEQTEKRLIDSILNFREKPVRKAMTPRTDIVAIDVETSIQEAIDLVVKTKRSRLPLYEGSLDNVLGVIYAKDLVRHMNSRKKFDKEQWLKIARQPIFVPETQRLDSVLREFQRARMHLAIVVDEYGGTAGIVTLEDVIEEIVGELSPAPKTEEPTHKVLSDGAHWFDASIPLEEASEILGKPLACFHGQDEPNYDTLGGFILHFAGEIPDEKQRVRHADLEFEIEKLDGNRILSVIVRPASPTQS